MRMGREDCCVVFETMEAERAALLAELRAWPEGRLEFRTEAGTWSAVEVLDHLVKAEAGTAEDMREGLKTPRALGEEERPKVAALERALRSEKRFKVPAGAGILPDAEVNFAEVVERWDAARGVLRVMVSGMSEEQARCGVFEHPFAGWMTMGEVLGHMLDHLYHHQFQLARLREASV